MKPEKSKPIGILGNLFVFVIVMGTLLTLLAVTGCDEAGQMMGPVIDNEPPDTVPPAMVGDIKSEPEPEVTPNEVVEAEPTDPEETPAEPTAPEDTTPPTVVEVAWYSDWQMTQSLTADSIVHPGDTVYTVVVFSEPVVHTVADETARPALFIVIDGMAERYRMLPHGVGFQSGEAKPLHDGTDDYLCKYTIPADTVGILALRVGSATADVAGNAVAEASVTAPFMVTEPVVEPPPMATEPMLPEPEGPGQTVLELPPGYTLPPHLTPETVVLSQTEQILIDAVRVIGKDALAPPHFTTHYAADVLSVLPYAYREEVHDLFVRSVKLPFFAEAAEKLKELNINLLILSAERRNTGNQEPYAEYLFNVAYKETGLVGGVGPETLRDIYFEESPTVPYEAGVSRNWFILEWYRLQLEHPELSVRDFGQRNELLSLYRKSCRDGNIFGLDKPWS